MSRTTITARVAAVAALILVTGAAYAHYEFVHYVAGADRIISVPEKFDLSALPNRTLYLFVPSTGPDKLAPGDSYSVLLSQIRLAAKTWNEVETSELRLEFGGFAASGIEQSTPRVDVVFQDLGEGLVAMGGPTTRLAMVTGDSGLFVPITRSVLFINTRYLSENPSGSEAFFLTLVHEFGHTLGLQHTFTSSVMSTQPMRSTTRANPLAADDVAGISMLYPSADFARKTANIAGRVTMDGRGVHLASVVAVAPAGAAVSALTDPDGYYRITGLPPGQYYLYVHPLPPGAQSGLGPADIVLPVNPDGTTPAGPFPLFETVFYPNAKAILQATIIAAPAGGTLEGCDFAVSPRNALEVHSVATYSFPGAYAVKPAFLNMFGPRNFLVASGVGITANCAPSPGLTADVVGGLSMVSPDGDVTAYCPYSDHPDISYLQVKVHFNPFTGPAPQHLVFTLNNDIYVLPAAFHVVRSQPPSVASVTPGVDGQGNQTAVLAGSNFVESTRVLFDGLPARVVGLDQTDGSLTVFPPPGASGQQAVVTALDSEGQSSMFLDAAATPTYTYGAAAAPSLAMSPVALAAGSEAMIEVTGSIASFTDGYTVIGFGSSDVVVRQVWVLGPDRLWANVHIASGAQQTTLPLTVVSGFRIATLPDALRVQAARPDVPVLDPTLVNPATGQPSIYSGGPAALTVSPLPSGAVALTVNGLPATITAVEEGRILFEVPAGLSVGPAVLRLTLGPEPIQPIVVVIDPAPPVIKAVLAFAIIPIGPNWPAVQGWDLWVMVAGLGDPSVVANPERVRISLGGVLHTPTQVTPSATDPNIHFVRFTVSSAVEAGASLPLTVAVGYRISQPVMIPVVAIK